MENNISRRGFLKNISAGLVALLGASTLTSALNGCATISETRLKNALGDKKIVDFKEYEILDRNFQGWVYVVKFDNGETKTYTTDDPLYSDIVEECYKLRKKTRKE